MTIRFKPTDMPNETQWEAPNDVGMKTTAMKDIWPFDWLPFGCEC